MGTIQNAITQFIKNEYGVIFGVVTMGYLMYSKYKQSRPIPVLYLNIHADVIWNLNKYKNLPQYRKNNLTELASINLTIRGTSKYHCEVADVVPIRDNLVTLTIDEVLGDSDEFTFIAICPNLKTLSFIQSNMPNEVERLTQLQSLICQHNLNPQFSLEALNKLTNLTNLDLSKNNFDLINILKIPKLIRTLENLTHLNLSFNNLEDDALYNIFRDNFTNTTLVILDLSHNSLNTIPTFIQCLASLSHLDLSHNTLNSDYTAIVPASTEKLNLEHTEISNENLKKILQKCTSLVSLNIVGNHILTDETDYLIMATMVKHLEMSTFDHQDLPANLKILTNLQSLILHDADNLSSETVQDWRFLIPGIQIHTESHLDIDEE